MKSMRKKSIVIFLVVVVAFVNSFSIIEAAPTNAVLVRSFNISDAGSACRMRVGDLDSDGRLDFLLVQATSDNPSQVNALTAYDYNGKLMWKIGTNNGQAGTDRDEPAQIYDIDNDGQNEVLCVMNKKFRILNGRDGKLEKEYNLPASDAHDCILICNLTGSAWPRDIILKNRYTNAYAVDKDFNLLWRFQGATGHYPWPYDFDGDGRDEVMMSYTMLDHDGKRLWIAKDPLDHADCIQMGNIDGNASNGMEIVLGTQGEYTVQAYNWKGNQLWQSNQLVEGQQVIIQDFRKDKVGLEIYGLDRVNRGSPGQDALFIFDSLGKLLWKEVPDNSGYATAIKKVNSWDSTNMPYCFAFKRGGNILPGLYDGNGNKVVQFPIEGNAMIGDFCGDSKQEVLIYTNTTANIYASGPVDYAQPAPNPGHMRQQLKEDYNFSRYGSGEVPMGNSQTTPPPTQPPATSTPIVPPTSTPTPTPTPTSTPSGIKKYDLNHDGAINMADIMIIASYFNAITGDARYDRNIDFNNDGSINMADIMMAASAFNNIV